MNRDAAIPVEKVVGELAPAQRFRSYPSRRDSGLQWLGSIPESWRVSRVKYVGRIYYGLGEPPERKDDGVAFVRATDIHRGVIQADSIQKVDPDAIPWSRAISLKPGDILVVRSGAYTGDSAIIPDNWQTAIAGYDMVIRPSKVHSRFLAYVLLSKYMLEGQIHLTRTRAAQPHLNAEELGSFTLLLPSSAEQRAIAAFLDRETARIDELIAKKQRLIELLAEKRTALISHAVTKGLNPDAPMMDSGIEWIGSIPKHWKAVQLRRVLHSIEQGWSPSCFNYPASLEEWGVLKAGCVNSGRLDENENKLLPPEQQPDPALQVHPGDVLMSRACGTPSLVGSVGFIESCRPRLLLCDKLFRLHMLERQAFAEFIALSLKSVASRGQIEGSINGAEGLANNITQATVRNLWLGVPPLSEQQQICVEVRARLSRLQELSSQIGAAIDILREYRSALISAAVTGKIDVREERSPC